MGKFLRADLDAFVGANDGTVYYYEYVNYEASIAAGTSPTEDGTTGTFTITLNKPTPDGGLTINYTVDVASSATSGTDYSALSGSVFIAANQTTGTIDISAIDDFVIDAGETIIVNLSTGSEYKVHPLNNTATLTIADNDVAGVTITPSNSSTDVVEGGATDTYTIALNTIPTAAVEITISADSQTEISVDGTNFAASQVVSLSDMTAKTITVRGKADAVIEGLHTGTIYHAITNSGDANYTASLAINSLTVNISDVNTPPTVSNITMMEVGQGDCLYLLG